MKVARFALALVASVLLIRDGSATDDEEDRSFDEVDFVVVGAGSGGAPAANRLSENKKFTTVLLEKGGFYPEPVAEVPALAPAMYATENADNYYVEKQPNFGESLINQQQIWLKGKGLGGTSLMNYMAYTWAHPLYFDRWAASGSPSWSWKKVLPVFKDLENYRSRPHTDTLRGTDGDLDVTKNSIRYKAGTAFLQACQQTGVKYLDDYNTQGFFGVGRIQANIRDGRRCDTGKAFIYDITKRPNFKVIVNAKVMKVIINPRTKKAEAVQYKKNGKTHTIKVRKEVVLSAGTIASPQLLMVSGVGPKKELDKHKIPVIQNLQVGQTVYDHIIYPGLVFVANETISPQNSLTQNPNNWRLFLDQGKGPLTVPSLALEAIGFVKTPVSNETADYPDIEYLYLSGSFSTDMGTAMRTEWRVSNECYDPVFRPTEGKSTWGVFPMLFHPRSKGTIGLRSASMDDNPILHGNYVTDPEGLDMRTLIASIRMIQKVAKTPAMARYGSKQVLTGCPRCQSKKPDSDEFWECMIRQIASGVWHQTTSCKMGPKADPEAVVDDKLRVHGIKGLRVADTSIFPSSITGHPSMPSMMVGAMCAKMILEEHTT